MIGSAGVGGAAPLGASAGAAGVSDAAGSAGKSSIVGGGGSGSGSCSAAGAGSTTPPGSAPSSSSDDEACSTSSGSTFRGAGSFASAERWSLAAAFAPRSGRAAAVGTPDRPCLTSGLLARWSAMSSLCLIISASRVSVAVMSPASRSRGTGSACSASRSVIAERIASIRRNCHSNNPANDGGMGDPNRVASRILSGLVGIAVSFCLLMGSDFAEGGDGTRKAARVDHVGDRSLGQFIRGVASHEAPRHVVHSDRKCGSQGD